MLIGHKKQWEFLKKKFELGQLSHAYLFTGAEGIGKKFFAKEFVNFIGCKFPDLLIIEPEDGKEISIAKIREAQNFLAYKSYNGGFKAIIIDGAEKMNQDGQSCFLKTLEEPKGKTILILVSSKPDMLLLTIASRCQTMKFLRPKDLPADTGKQKKSQEILGDLTSLINSGFSDKFKYAKSLDFETQDFGEILEVMQKYFRNLLLIEAGIEKPIVPIIKKYPIKKIKDIINLIEDINNKFLFTNASPKLALEILLMEL
jgi:DNA polymerase-3 subunit delta'